MTATDIATATPMRSNRVGAQFVRYLCVGCFNTLFGYTTYATTLALLSHRLPQHYLYLTVVLASAISTPISITFAFFGYKHYVFRTRGNHLREWLKAFAVYGAGSIPAMFALSAITRVLQSSLPTNPVTWMNHTATMRSLAGYIAGAIVMALQTFYSFFAHRHITFKARPS